MEDCSLEIGKGSLSELPMLSKNYQPHCSRMRGECAFNNSSESGMGRQELNVDPNANKPGQKPYQIITFYATRDPIQKTTKI